MPSLSQSHPLHTDQPFRTALLWTHYHGTICRLFEPALHIRPPIPSPTRTTALWTCLNAARDLFASYTALPPQNLPCMPFHSAHLSFCAITTVRLLFPPNSSGDVDWTPTVARETAAFEDVLERLSGFFDEADRSCAGGQRRARYIDQDRTVLGFHRDKIRWIREWCVARGRSGGARSSHSGGQMQPLHRSEEAEGLGEGGGESDGSGMEVEYSGAHPQEQMLDEVFWDALFDWSWSGNGGMGEFGMEVQLRV